MHIEFDPVKSALNAKERDLPFSLASEFNFATALIWQDMRQLYPEIRFSCLGFIGHRIHALCFTPIPDGIRIISLRKANSREVTHYEDAKKIKNF